MTFVTLVLPVKSKSTPYSHTQWMHLTIDIFPGYVRGRVFSASQLMGASGTRWKELEKEMWQVGTHEGQDAESILCGEVPVLVSQVLEIIGGGVQDLDI